MPKRDLCPDKQFGRGCDYAELPSRALAFLYEKKSCAWSRAKASDAIVQLDNSKDDLRVHGWVDANCKFVRAVLREKDSPRCRTDGVATAYVLRNGVAFMDARSDRGRQILDRYERRLAQYSH